MKKLCCFLGTLVLGSLASSTIAQEKSYEDLKPVREMMRKVRAENPGEPFRMVVPLHGRVLSFGIPDPFEMAYQAQDRVQFIQEFIPQGQTLDNWGEMITIVSLKQLGKSPKSTEYLARALAMDPSKCIRGWDANILDAHKAPDGLEYVLTFSSCGATRPGAYIGATDKKSEQNIIYTFRDESNVYSVQYARRDDNQKKQSLVMTKQNAFSFIEPLGRITLCKKDSPTKECEDVLAIEKLRRDMANKNE